VRACVRAFVRACVFQVHSDEENVCADWNCVHAALHYDAHHFAVSSWRSLTVRAKGQLSRALKKLTAVI